jgi:lipopolysaccharide transport system ATP-binding protein
MGENVIRVSGISKRYLIGERSGYPLLRDLISGMFSSPFRKHEKSDKNVLWALRDISFEVKEGEVIGLVGRNGAGKSTLLKILARITRPTTGSAEMHGRIGSLLEVGTGFHGELTGRENVFLTGSILGMKKAEIARRFEEIVAFSEVERFLDTPLKHYSSGMQMRLAFAVAAHLEPEILLVDEVLAVGDASFQKKCLGKMGEVASQGRTIIFVSHSMAAVNALCSRAVMLEQGKISFEGPTSEITARYYSKMMGQIDARGNLDNTPRVGTGKARFTSISIRAASSSEREEALIETGCELVVETNVVAHCDLPESNVAVIIYDSSGYRLIDVNLNQRGQHLKLNRGDKASVRFQLKEVLLKPGTYMVGLWIGRDNIEQTDGIDCAATFVVAPKPEFQTHSVVFPGSYLCQFDTEVSMAEEGVPR